MQEGGGVTGLWECCWGQWRPGLERKAGAFQEPERLGEGRSLLTQDWGAMGRFRAGQSCVLGSFTCVYTQIAGELGGRWKESQVRVSK